MNMIRYSGPTLISMNPQTLFDSNGDCTKWAQARRAGLSRRGKREAPHGSDSGRTRKSSANPEPFGSLKAGVKGSTSRTGPLQFQITLESTVRYSIFVIKGTKTPITANKARLAAGTVDPATGRKIGGQYAEGRRGMFLPPNSFGGKNYKGGVPVQKVRGQRPNDFLSRAVRGEARLHPALLGYDDEA